MTSYTKATEWDEGVAKVWLDEVERRAKSVETGEEETFHFQAKGLSRGRQLVNRLRGSATVDMTTDEILALTRGED